MALNALRVQPPFAVAVSGGADSLSLLILAAEWCKRRKTPPPLALTVDHALREGSAAEAERVAGWARAQNVPHQILTWTARKPAANIQASARQARYALIGEAMRRAGVKVLLTGHTEDDQAETFLLRLARGSGLDGLGGMAPLAGYPLAGFANFTLARPLLDIPHDRLVATLKARKQKWIEDPSNENQRFARVQVRNAMPALAEAGVTRERIASATAHLRRAREAIEFAVANLILTAVDLTPWGYATLDAEAFADAPAEVALRALSRVLEIAGGAAYAPRFDQTEAALAWIVARDAELKGRTLGGCRLMRRPDSGKVLVAREDAALARDDAPVEIEPGQSALWDRRFLITLSEAPGALRLSRLGTAGLKVAGKACLPTAEPHRIAVTTPALWRQDRLVAAPLLGFSTEAVVATAHFVGLSDRTLRNPYANGW